MSRRFDLVIIGSGAGGGTLAHALAETGADMRKQAEADHLVNEVT